LLDGLTIIMVDSKTASKTCCLQCAWLSLWDLRFEIDNKEAVDLTHNWSVGGWTCHVEVRQYFLHDLKEEDVIIAKWISGNSNFSDLFMKHLPGPLFEKHMATHCGEWGYTSEWDLWILMGGCHRLWLRDHK
jgi:hypothetical protein